MRPPPSHDQRKHVLFVLSSLTMGGAETQFLSLLEADPDALRRLRLTVLTIRPQRHPVIESRLQALGLPVHLIDRTSMGFASFFGALLRFMRRERPDAVHCLLAGSTGTWGRLAARLAGVRHVMISDLSLDPELSRTQRLLDPLVNRLTDRFLPNAEAIAQRLQRQGVPEHKIRLVRNGVDFQRFQAEHVDSARPGWGLPGDAVVAGYLGMMRPEKRPDLLLDALLRMPPDRRPDYVVFAGDGALMPELRQRVEADPWLTSHVKLLGVVADTPAFLKGIDFLVLTSDTEGTPNAVLEAMAMGLPCVATRVSDVPHIVAHHGEVVEPGDAEAVAKALARMTALSHEERRGLGAGGRERVRAEYDMAVATARFWETHWELLGTAL